MNNLHNPLGGQNPQITGVNPDNQIGGSDTAPKDGGWSEWSIGSCDKTCGGGNRQDNRTCNNPAPKNGGRPCEGESSRMMPCNPQACDGSQPIDGGWTTWSNVGTCSSSCGMGFQNQNRTCSAPAPANGGLDCIGSDSQTIECNGIYCPVDGGWGPWFNYGGGCSVLCGGGTVQQKRNCDSPTPQYGGLFCTGESARIKVCNEHVCPEISVTRADCSNSENKLFIDASFSPVDGVIYFAVFQGSWWNDLSFSPTQGTTLPGTSVYVSPCPGKIKVMTNRGGELEVDVHIID